jgi:anhydro-N-acetylmuramic acid kinase
MPTRLLIGAMSGTSADGVDAALVAIDGHGLAMRCTFRHHLQRPYPSDLRRRIFAIRSAGIVSLSELATLAHDISDCYAQTVNALLAATAASPSDIHAVAAHGQTLFHAPPNTIQWLDPALLAARTRCRVVSDFRRADCAAGGQGAPLVPFADYVLFRDPKLSRVLLNLGGIANLTYLGAGDPIDRVIAFDTGPANCISDALMRKHDPHGPGFDASGTLAAAGRPIPQVADRVLKNVWFASKPPKSTDGPAMIRLFDDAVQTENAETAKLNDLLATSCLIAARAIRESISRWVPGKVDELIVSGGGSQNAVLMHHLDGIAGRTFTTDAFGVPSSATEAIAFALLAAASLDGIPANVPSATGARSTVLLGSITPSPVALAAGPAELR